MAVNAREHRNVIDEVARLNKVEIEFLWEVLKNSMIPGRNIHIAYDVINKLKRQHQIASVDKKDLKLSKDKVIKFWIEQNLPVSKTSLDTNTIKLNAVQLSNIKFDELLLQQLEIIKTKNSKLRKKKLY